MPKISQLPPTPLSFVGNELVIINQNGNTYSSVLSNFTGGGSNVSSLSANWQNTYTTVQANSGNWTNNYTTTQANSARWSSVYNTVYALSAAWEESAEILPTVTNYLSTNNVRLSSVTMSGNIDLSGNNLLNASLIRGVSGSPPSFPDGLKAVGGSTCFLPPSGGNLLSESVPYNAGTFTSSNILLNRANGNMQKLTLSTSTTFTLSAPLNGSEGRTLTARISCGSGSNRSITFDTPILKPSDSGITFPKTLTSGKTYITKLYHNGAAWELITLIGGYG